MPTLADIKGISSLAAEKLKEAGIDTVEAVAVTPARVLAEILGVSEEKALKISQNARNLLGVHFITAEEYFEKRRGVAYISTGCRSLDDILGGGVETQSVTEFVGEFGAGKTQLCHQLCVMVQLPVGEGGLEGKAVYIDTEGTFRPERIVQMAEYRGIEPRTALRNIIYARAYTTDHQMLLVEEITKRISRENIRLLVVDSLVGLFRTEYPGRENLASRQQKLNRHVHQLLKIADVYNLAVVVTNQVVADPDSLIENPLRPAGGNIVAHGCTYRIWLRKGRGNRRIAIIFDSPKHPESEAVFMITTEGVLDVF